jgi:hypothetical protein
MKEAFRTRRVKDRAGDFVDPCYDLEGNIMRAYR